MAQSFPETAHLKTDQKKYAENWEAIFGNKEDVLENLCCTICGELEEMNCGCHDKLTGACSSGKISDSKSEDEGSIPLALATTQNNSPSRQS